MLSTLLKRAKAIKKDNLFIVASNSKDIDGLNYITNLINSLTKNVAIKQFCFACPYDCKEYLEFTKEVELSKGIVIKPQWFPEEKPNKMDLNYKLHKDLNLSFYETKVQGHSYWNNKDYDIIIIRENLLGEFSHIENEIGGPDEVELEKITSKQRVRNLAEFAIKEAIHNKKDLITYVHKANIQKMGDGMFFRESMSVSDYFPKIQRRGMIVDNCTMQLIQNPDQFKILVCPNLYGRIIQGICNGLFGSGYFLPSIAINEEQEIFLIEPGHNYNLMAVQDECRVMSFLYATVRYFDLIEDQINSTKVKSALDLIFQDKDNLTKITNGELNSDKFIKMFEENMGHSGS